MENNLKGINIEFYGIPGCGKSVISHKLAQILKKEGFQVFEPTYNIVHEKSAFYRKIWKIFASLKLIFINYKSVTSIKSILRNNNLKFKNYVSQVINILPKVNIYLNQKSYINIWDEGLVQSSISLSNAKSSKENFYNIKENLENIKIIAIYVNVDFNIAIDRMKNRKIHGSRIEKEDDYAKKIEMLNDFKLKCDSIENKILIKVDSTSDSPEIIANHIMNCIREEL